MNKNMGGFAYVYLGWIICSSPPTHAHTPIWIVWTLNRGDGFIDLKCVLNNKKKTRTRTFYVVWISNYVSIWKTLCGRSYDEWILFTVFHWIVLQKSFGKVRLRSVVWNELILCRRIPSSSRLHDRITLDLSCSSRGKRWLIWSTWTFRLFVVQRIHCLP